MKQQYRIVSWRMDERLSVYSEPTFEGETLDVCDHQAVEHFRTVSDMPEHAWDGMALVRIDTPATAEKTTQLESNGRQQPTVD